MWTIMFYKYKYKVDKTAWDQEMPNTQDVHVEIFSTQADHLNDAHIVPHILV